VRAIRRCPHCGKEIVPRSAVQRVFAYWERKKAARLFKSCERLVKERITRAVEFE
jgi:hypothetical protein